MHLARAIVAIAITAAVLTSGAAGVGTVLDTDSDGVDSATEWREGTDSFASDSDDDGLDDGAERDAGTDPLTADTDGDGLADGSELDIGTDPLVVDTDGDGLADGEEQAEHDTDPLAADSDGDGLEDGTEMELATEPLTADTDGDGLDDGAERDAGTDPLTTDTDGDGLADGTELSDHETDPLSVDTDDDGLEDEREVSDHVTDPLSSDTDDDGLADGTEREVGTDPLVADTDGDALADGAEHDHGVDPLVVDTDGDGLPDGAEVHRTDRYPDADPARTDVYLEVDQMEGTTIEDGEIAAMTAAFADAPLENPDGTTGVDLHVVLDTVPRQSAIEYGMGDGSDYDRYRSRHFDNAGYGYHHALLVSDVDASVGGFATSGRIVVKHYDRKDVTGSILIHELGHSLGLRSGTFRGIDGHEPSFEEYPSVMNYDAPLDYYAFSSGEASPNDFNDWGYLAENMHTPATDALETDSKETGSP